MGVNSLCAAAEGVVLVVEAGDRRARRARPTFVDDGCDEVAGGFIGAGGARRGRRGSRDEGLEKAGLSFCFEKFNVFEVSRPVDSLFACKQVFAIYAFYDNSVGNLMFLCA
jgi:hypothetical protein